MKLSAPEVELLTKSISKQEFANFDINEYIKIKESANIKIQRYESARKREGKRANDPRRLNWADFCIGMKKDCKIVEFEMLGFICFSALFPSEKFLDILINKGIDLNQLYNPTNIDEFKSSIKKAYVAINNHYGVEYNGVIKAIMSSKEILSKLNEIYVFDKELLDSKMPNNPKKSL